MAHDGHLADEADALEAPRDPISLEHAARIAGLSVQTIYTHTERGRLKTARQGHRRYTTRRWLDAYLTQRSAGRMRHGDAAHRAAVQGASATGEHRQDQAGRTPAGSGRAYGAG